MRLKSLYIKGFKSFAQETIIHFNESVTGIVGPNGSGKSNIIDAIRWVLGEQKSKELRLAKMQDVIFNGTASKKASKTAEVAIEFENNRGIIPSEYQIIRISRTLYRSGESSYQLNNIPCRLKDIHNLLMDTGIGSNSYAIIELSMVDAILQDKDHARRKMFEQAAGVSKYKKRKRETINKLSLTQTDLDRIEDVLFEIRKNLKQLEKQARNAKRYLALKDAYKQESLLFHYDALDEILDQQISIRKKQMDLKLLYNQLRADIDKQEAVLQRRKYKHVEDERQLALFQKKINTVVDQIRTKENKKNLLLEQEKYIISSKKQAEQTLLRLRSELDELVVRQASTVKIYKDHETSLERLVEQYEHAHEQHTTKKQRFETIKNELDLLAQKKSSIENQLFSIEKEMAIADNKRMLAIKSTEHLHEKKFDTQSRIEIEQQKVQEKIAENNEIQKQIQHLEAAEVAKENSEKALKEEKIKLEAAQRVLLRKGDKSSAEVKFLRNILNNLEGLPAAIKYLSKHWKKNQILFSDIIDCPDVYRSAVEQYFKPFLDHFVVQSSDEAFAAVRILQENNIGFAKFFILDQVPKNEHIITADLDGVVMHSILSFEEQYRSLVEWLCGNVIIRKDVPTELSGKYVHYVNQQGTCVFSNGKLVGGASGVLDSSRIGQKQKLKRMESHAKQVQDDIDMAKIAIEKINSEILQLQEKSNKSALQKLNQDLNRGLQNQYETAAKLKQAQNHLEEVEIELKGNLGLIEKSDTVLKELRKQSEILAKEKTQLESESHASADIAQLSMEMTASTTALNQLNIEKIRQENLNQTVSKDLEFIEEKIHTIHTDSARLEDTMVTSENKLDQITVDCRTLEDELVELYKQKKTEHADLSATEKVYFDTKQQLEEQEQVLRKTNKTFQNVQSELNHLKDKETDLKYKLDGLKQRVLIEFNEQLSALEIEVPDGYNRTEQQLKVDKLKHKISTFGEVNPMAVDTYNEMQNRLELIENQRDDILGAKKELTSTIREIEKTATAQFLDAFNAARGHFQTVFRSLFTQDDTCDLILLDPEDPLQSDIEIIAKPKGKRPQSLSQLSGGEKTLTASALLFSLYLLKPAPFCIFDEVDAPLDDQNVQKFTNIIRAFSDESQFLVVTHNKATMAELDVLYGVFMEEKGVSSISAVDFRSMAHEPKLQHAVG